jgi:CubicO group peptidase (beta-lactamase class C family)
MEAYHGVSASTHQANFDRLSKAGNRMISLSVYGDPSNAQYAAVWVKRAGSPWVATHGLNFNQYQNFFDTWTKKGYVPTLISATGTPSNAIFAAVFEQGIKGAWFTSHGYTSGSENNAGTFQNANKSARSQQMILKSFAIYGTNSDRRYAAIYHANPGFTKWHVYTSDTAASYQTNFNAEISLPNYRAASVALSGDQMYCSLFKDDMVGEWSARHGITAAEYQAEFDKQVNNGFYPISVQGGGSGGNTRYAVIFAKRDIQLERVWTVKGTIKAGLGAFDNTMKAFMQSQAVRSAQLSISKNGVSKVSRAYTWAEPGYHITQPSDTFLLASCSKMFLEAAVQSLYDTPAFSITPSTKVYPKLGFSNPKDKRSDDITVQQLLDHMGGYDDTNTGSGFDPTYKMRDIALALNLNGPVTKKDVAKYMYAQNLDFTPGTNNKYSNYGYLLLSLLIEVVTKKDYFAYLKAAVLDPANITEVKVWPTVANPRPAGEVIHEDTGLGLSAVNVKSPLLVPNVYGGDGEIKEVGAAPCGTAASANAMVQFIRTHAVWGNGGRAPGAARAGSTPGTSTMAGSRGDGIDWAFTIATRNWTPNAPTDIVGNLSKDINKLIDSMGGTMLIAKPAKTKAAPKTKATAKAKTKTKAKPIAPKPIIK